MGMGSVHNLSTTPDLFSDSVARSASSASPSSLATAASTQRHILPSNLPAAIKQLNDGELDQLLSAVLAEQKRRGRRPPGSNESARNQHAQELAPPLTQGKLNAVRAAFKAGVTPSRIVRQFGVTQSQVRKALAADKATG